MYIDCNSISELLAELKNEQESPDDFFMLMLAEQTPLDLSRLVEALNEAGISYAGAVFPAVIHNNVVSHRGVIFTRLKMVAEPILFQEFTLEEVQQKIPHDLGEGKTALILVDGMMPDIAKYLSLLYAHLGNRINYLGGGAGSLSLQQKPCVFFNKGVFQNAAILVFLKQKSQMGVRHGWKKIAGPFVATKTSKNIIKELNWENAFEVYKREVERDSGLKFTDGNFFEIAKGYPFGIYKEGFEYTVRDPLSLSEENHLVCVGEVRENTVLDILKGETRGLIDAARETSDDLMPRKEKPQSVLLFDCLSRVLFLGDDFPKELQAISDSLNKVPIQIPMEGVISLGEISSDASGILEFFNKTIVTGIIYE